MLRVRASEREFAHRSKFSSFKCASLLAPLYACTGRAKYCTIHRVVIGSVVGISNMLKLLARLYEVKECLCDIPGVHACISVRGL